MKTSEITEVRKNLQDLGFNIAQAKKQGLGPYGRAVIKTYAFTPDNERAQIVCHLKLWGYTAFWSTGLHDIHFIKGKTWQ